ncbi:MAG: hypothetical protein VX611_03490 [Bacteroidota bacterium]|nr:hypothetical protein [Bacteroidota bacterium]
MRWPNIMQAGTRRSNQGFLYSRLVFSPRINSRYNRSPPANPRHTNNELEAKCPLGLEM